MFVGRDDKQKAYLIMLYLLSKIMVFKVQTDGAVVKRLLPALSPKGLSEHTHLKSVTIYFCHLQTALGALSSPPVTPTVAVKCSVHQ